MFAIGERTLVLHWNGSHWSRLKSPSPCSVQFATNVGYANELNDVSAQSRTNAWAVGGLRRRRDRGHRDADPSPGPTLAGRKRRSPDFTCLRPRRWLESLAGKGRVRSARVGSPRVSGVGIRVRRVPSALRSNDQRCFSAWHLGQVCPPVRVEVHLPR